MVITLLPQGFHGANIAPSWKGVFRRGIEFNNHKLTKEIQMLEPDTTTSEVVFMYVGIFVFLFGLAFMLMKKHSW